MLWWLWSAYAWLTNSLDPEEGAVRLAVFAAIAAMLIVSLAARRAFGRDGVLFGVAYLVVRVLHLVLFAIAGRGDRDLLRAVLRIAPGAILGAGPVGGRLQPLMTGGFEIPTSTSWSEVIVNFHSAPQRNEPCQRRRSYQIPCAANCRRILSLCVEESVERNAVHERVHAGRFAARAIPETEPFALSVLIQRYPSPTRRSQLQGRRTPPTQSSLPPQAPPSWISCQARSTTRGPLGSVSGVAPTRGGQPASDAEAGGCPTKSKRSLKG